MSKTIKQFRLENRNLRRELATASSRASKAIYRNQDLVAYLRSLKPVLGWVAKWFATTIREASGAQVEQPLHEAKIVAAAWDLGPQGLIQVTISPPIPEGLGQRFGVLMKFVGYDLGELIKMELRGDDNRAALYPIQHTHAGSGIETGQTVELYPLMILRGETDGKAVSSSSPAFTPAGREEPPESLFGHGNWEMAFQACEVQLGKAQEHIRTLEQQIKDQKVAHQSDLSKLAQELQGQPVTATATDKASPQYQLRSGQERDKDKLIVELKAQISFKDEWISRTTDLLNELKDECGLDRSAGPFTLYKTVRELNAPKNAIAAAREDHRSWMEQFESERRGSGLVKALGASIAGRISTGMAETITLLLNGPVKDEVIAERGLGFNVAQLVELKIARRRHGLNWIAANVILKDAATGADLIALERMRQQYVEGYDAKHDDAEAAQPLSGLFWLARAAYCYVLFAIKNHEQPRPLHWEAHPAPSMWPWAWNYWKPTADPIRNLERAGALIAAQIDLLLRRKAAADSQPGKHEAASSFKTLKPPMLPLIFADDLASVRKADTDFIREALRAEGYDAETPTIIYAWSIWSERRAKVAWLDAKQVPPGRIVNRILAVLAPTERDESIRLAREVGLPALRDHTPPHQDQQAT